MNRRSRTRIYPCLLRYVLLIRGKVGLPWLFRVTAKTPEACANEHFKAMVEGSIQGFLIHRHRRPLFVNQAFAEMLDYGSPAEVLALGSTERIYAPHEHQRMRGYQIGRLQGGEAPIEYEVEALRKDGTVVVLHTVVHTTLWQGRQATQHNCIDITARKQAEQALDHSEERFFTALNSINEAFALYDEHDCLVFLNQAYLEHHSTRLHERIKPGLAFTDLVRAVALAAAEDGLIGKQEIDAFITRRLQQHANPGKPFETSRNGRWYRYCEHRTEGGWIMVIITDVNDLKLREIELTKHRRSLQVSHDRFRHVFEHAPIGIWEEDWSALKPAIDTLRASGVTDFAHYFQEHPQQVETLISQIRTLDVNAAAVRIYRAGSKLKFFNMLSDSRWIRGQIPSFSKILSVLAEGETRFVIEGPEQVFDGSEIYINSTIAIADNYQRNWVRVVHTTADISETYKLTRELSFHASHDELTGLINRGEFEQRLMRVLETAQESNSTHALCYMDLDQFKVINDSCGHGAGDELLCSLPQHIHPHIRVRDTLARLGGDEFAILMEHCSVVDAQRVAEAVREAIEKFQFQWQGRPFRISVSIGLVAIDADSRSLAATLSAADAACYAAKDTGRNRVHVYQENNAELKKYRGAMHWVTRIRQALDEDRFVLESQTIAPVSDPGERGTHYELLVRMLDESGKLIPPGEFLPVAERFQLATALDRWVVNAALAWLGTHPRQLRETRLCSINLSGQSLGNEKFAAHVAEQFSRHKVPYEKICFEITETAVIGNLGGATRFIEKFKALGCSFALDDFGSGLSSFAYLKTLPVDILKIDGIFVKNMDSDSIDYAMVRIINEIGHLMGKRTVAEFVENDRILQHLTEIGVDYAQGYAIGKPQALGKIIEFRKVAG